MKWRWGLGLSLLAMATLAGCNKSPSVTANAPPGGSGQGSAPAGVPDRPSMSLPGAGGQANNDDDDTPRAAAAPPAPTEGAAFDFGASGRPRMGLGGGGGAGGGGGGGSYSVKPPNGPGGKGMANGFYPVFTPSGIAANGAASGATSGTIPQPTQSGFGGALYPAMQTGDSVAANNPASNTPNNPSEPNNQRATAATDAPAAAPDSFLKMAQEAFNKGDEDKAIKLLYAHFLADESARDKFPVQWYGDLARPRLMLRWGVAVNYDAPRGENDRPPVIGDDAAPRTPRSSAGDSDVVGASSSGPLTNAATSNSAYAKVDTSTPIGAYLYYTGDFGERLYRRLNDRRKHADAYFGKILKELDERKPSTAGAPSAAAVVAPPTEIRDRPNISFGGGGGAQGGGAGRQAPAGGGDTPAGGNARGGSAVGAALKELTNRWSTTEAADAPARDVNGTLLPGVYFMGMGHRDQMVERGKKLGLDLVIVIDVKLIKGSGNTDFTTTVARLFDVNDPEKPIASTKSLKYADVAETRERISNEKNDPVEVELDKLFRDVVDKGYKAAEMPAAVKEHVERRLDMILESESSDKLRAATEIVGYVDIGFLDPEKAKSALNRLIEGSGEMLLTGNASDRKKYLEELVSKSDDTDSGSSDSEIR